MDDLDKNPKEKMPSFPGWNKYRLPWYVANQTWEILKKIDNLINYMKEYVSIEENMKLMINDDGSLKKIKKGSSQIRKSIKNQWYIHWLPWKVVSIELPWIDKIRLFISDDEIDGASFNNLKEYSYTSEDFINFWDNIKNYVQTNEWINIDENINYSENLNRRGSEEKTRNTCDAIKIMREMISLPDGNYWVNSTEMSDWLVKYSSSKSGVNWFSRTQRGLQKARIIVDVNKLLNI